MMRDYESVEYSNMQRQQLYQQQQQQQPPPFRVLSPGGRILYEPQAVLRSPPPARAPEPYKVAPQASIYGRNQRKSSFAIIAETRPPSPQVLAVNSRPGSPQHLLSSGRLSPFRGRGFKGPPPRSHSRPDTPPEESSGRAARSRYDRRVSTSQQSSPKRSQIPRPARSRSISASKEKEQNRPSPKFGRRAVNRYTSSIGGSNNNQRRSPPQKETSRRKELSPIQGTPPPGKTGASADRNKQKQIATAKPVSRSFGAQRTNRSPEKINRNLLAPPKNVPGGKRFITAKTPTAQVKVSSTEQLDSSSKIPLRRGSITGNTGNSNSTAPLAKVSSSKSTTNNTGTQQQIQNDFKNNDDSSETFKVISGKKTSTLKNGTQPSGEEDLGLVDLLKQSSGATGTSSVVNTTTTTAVQPLQIDAASILADGELVAKLTSLEKKQKNLEMEEKSPDSQMTTNSKNSHDNENKTTSTSQQSSSNANNNQAAKANSTEDKSNSGTNSRNSNRTETMIKHFGPNAASEEKSLNNDTTTTTTTTTTTSSNTAANQAKTNESSTSAATEVEKASDESIKQSTEEQDKQRQVPTSTSTTSGHKKTDSKTSIARSSSKSTNSTNDSKKASPSMKMNSSTDAAANGPEEKMKNSSQVKRNAEPSLKTQAQAVSSESLASIRSTDTGVSVNTVRGVSSAKEKTGLHLVKRTEEIETLSGNIVHLDRNGDNATRNEESINESSTPGGTRWQRLRTRWWNRLGAVTRLSTAAAAGGAAGAAEAGRAGEEATAASRYGKLCASCGYCWPKMRCLACRRDPKAQLWPGKQARAASTAQLTATPTDKNNTRWARLKELCRCARVRDGRWCGWRRRRMMQQQVRPAELQAQCCPPERRLGNICRSLFSRCSCASWPCRRRQSEQSQRNKSVRAKHSLTSVAAPPLSEETRPKIPDVLVEHNSVMRGAIPCLPVPIAWFCLMLNVLLPGSGTVISGIFNLCFGQPRFSAVASPRARFGALIVNTIVGVSQLFTVLFCLVGWGWSIWWGVTMVRLARKYKRFKDSEAAANDPEGRVGPETATLPAPGVPAQALRGMERAR